MAKLIGLARVPVLLAIAILASSCAEAADDSAPAAGGGEDAAANVSEARELVEEAMEDPAFTQPTEPFDMSQNRGKTVWFISPTLGLPIQRDIIAGYEEAAEVAGINVRVWDGKGLPAEQNKGIQQAIAQGADGIHIQAIDPGLVDGSLEDAAEADIPVIESQNREPDEPVPSPIFGQTTFSFAGAGKLLADYVIANSDGQANVLYFNDPEFPALIAQEKGVKSEFERLCPDCTLEIQHFRVATFQTELPSTVATLLRRHPDTDWIIVCFDGAVVFVEQGVRSVPGAEENVRLVSADAVEDNLKAIRAGRTIQEADVGLPLNWFGWANLDLLGRAMLDETAVRSVELPVRFLTEENLPASDDDLFVSANWREEYKRLWGIE